MVISRPVVSKIFVPKKLKLLYPTSSYNR